MKSVLCRNPCLSQSGSTGFTFSSFSTFSKARDESLSSDFERATSLPMGASMGFLGGDSSSWMVNLGAKPLRERRNKIAQRSQTFFRVVEFTITLKPEPQGVPRAAHRSWTSFENYSKWTNPRHSNLPRGPRNFAPKMTVKERWVPSLWGAK